MAQCSGSGRLLRNNTIDWVRGLRFPLDHHALIKSYDQHQREQNNDNDNDHGALSRGHGSGLFCGGCGYLALGIAQRIKHRNGRGIALAVWHFLRQSAPKARGPSRVGFE